MRKNVSLYAAVIIVALLLVMGVAGVFSGADASDAPFSTPQIRASVAPPAPEKPLTIAQNETQTDNTTITPTPSTKPTVVGPSGKFTPLSPEEEKRRAASREALAKKIAGFINSDPAWIDSGAVGVYIATADRGNVVYSKNGNLSLIPASNMKAVTTAAALSLLGPDYKFETALWGTNSIKGGVMQGNLYLQGTGDPTMMYPWTGNPTWTFHEFAKVLRKRGVTVIEGDLVGDDSAFDREFQGRGWKQRYMLEDYAAPVGALTVNGNLVQLGITGANVSMTPGNKYMQITRKSSGDYLTVWRKPGTDQVTVNGPFASGTTCRSITVNNPSKYTTAVFCQVLAANGIKVKGKVRLIASGEEYQSKYQKIAFHNSVELQKIIRETNKESDNILAFHIFKAIGYKMKKQGTINSSNAAVKEWMQSFGADTSGFAMADGSGLSVYNRISPHLMADVLRHMSGEPTFKYFWSSLPASGVDGTLVYRMPNLQVRAKTGTISGHVGLSGYVKTKTGQLLVFSILTNRHNSSGDRIRSNEDHLLNIVAGWGEKL